MMEVPLGDTYYFAFTTRAFATGIPTTLAGTPALSVKEEGNDTIITSGVSVDVDTGATPVTGLHEASVVATSGNGYEVGKYYSVYISTGTVGGVSVVGEVVGHFRVVPAEDAGAGIRDVNVTHVSDSAEDIATATALATAQTDLDTITGADGVTLAASQSNTVTFPAINITGLLNIDNGIDVSCSTAGRSAIKAVGNGSGSGMFLEGGTSGNGLLAQGAAGGSGNGIQASGATNGGSGMRITANSTNGSGLLCDGNGTGHGIQTTSAGTGSGIEATSTGGGTGIVADITGDITGTIDTVTDVTNGVTVTTNNDKTGYSLTATTGLGNQTANITGNLSGSVGSVTGAVGSVTGNVGGNVVGSVASVTAGVSLANGAVTNASLAGNMEIVFETDFATNYNATANAWNADMVAISTSTTAADNLELSGLSILPFTVTGSPSATSIPASGLTAITGGDDILIGRTIIMTSGTLQYEAARITDYDDATGTMTVTTMSASGPSAADTGIII